MKVFVLSKGERGEGGTVLSVHETFDGASMAADEDAGEPVTWVNFSADVSIGGNDPVDYYSIVETDVRR